MPRRMLLLLAVVAARCTAAQELLFDVVPAWDGMIRAGASSEIGLRLVAARGGEVTVTLETPTTRTDYTATLDTDVALQLALPLPATLADLARVDARFNGLPGMSREVQLKSLPPDKQVVAVIGETGSTWYNGKDFSVIHPGTISLPRHDQSYAVIDLLVMDTASLQQLSAAQAGALQAYLATCGRFIGYRTAQPVIEVLRGNAGCGSRLLKTADNPQQLEKHVAALVESPLPELPSIAALRSLLPDEDRQAWIMPLASFFALYFLALLIAARSRRGKTFLPAIPVLASLLGLFAWSGGAVQTRLVSWAEMESGSRTARYSALLEARARARGEVQMMLPIRTGPPEVLQPHALIRVHHLPGDAALQLAFPARLFSHHEFILHGSLDPNLPLELSIAASGPVIDNYGTAPSPPCLLAWHGNKFSVPPLSPGERWIAPAVSEVWGNSGAEQILRERALLETAILLIPYSLVDAGIFAADTDSHGFLMVHL